jgi:hypothetical protein
VPRWSTHIVRCPRIVKVDDRLFEGEEGGGPLRSFVVFEARTATAGRLLVREAAWITTLQVLPV